MKKDCAPVQAADILAWQWFTDVKHSILGKPRRKDFESLIESPFRGFHFNREGLINYIAILEEFGLSQTKERSIDEEVARILYIKRRSSLAMLM